MMRRNRLLDKNNKLINNSEELKQIWTKYIVEVYTDNTSEPKQTDNEEAPIMLKSEVQHHKKLKV